MISSRPLRLIAAALVLAVTACGDSGPSEPVPGETRPETTLNIIELAANAPPLFNNTVSFWAFRGRDTRGEIFFRNSDGSRGERYVRLDLSDRALLSYPDGRPFAEGDSVLITIRVTDPQRVLIEFQPSGLKFNPAEPAELEIRYNNADHDFNHDGDDDEEDHQIEQILSIWRQETAADPFIRLGTIRIEELKELDARLLGFSRLAIAY